MTSYRGVIHLALRGHAACVCLQAKVQVYFYADQHSNSIYFPFVARGVHIGNACSPMVFVNKICFKTNERRMKRTLHAAQSMQRDVLYLLKTQMNFIRQNMKYQKQAECYQGYTSSKYIIYTIKRKTFKQSCTTRITRAELRVSVGALCAQHLLKARACQGKLFTYVILHKHLFSLKYMYLLK